jgi:hypothetical protein
MSNFSTPNAPEFESRHIGPREQDTREMLQTIGVSGLEELIQQTIPASIRVQKDPVIETFESQPKEVRLMAYKLLVDKFNEKYSVLDESQKQLLNKYITHVNDTTELRSYIQTIIPTIKKQLADHEMYNWVESATPTATKNWNGKFVKRAPTKGQYINQFRVQELIQEKLSAEELIFAAAAILAKAKVSEIIGSCPAMCPP